MTIIKNNPIPSNYIPSPIDENVQWVMGDACSPAQVLRPDGQWVSVFPDGERQNKNGLETLNCTNYSLLNCVEALGRLKYKTEFQNNLSERERGIRSRTTKNGNYIHNVCECLRTQGAIPEAFLPFTNSITSWDAYYTPNPLPYSLWKVSESWKNKYVYNHDWVFVPTDSLETKQEKMMEAMKYSPLTVAGYAWSKRANGLYYSDGTANHAFDVVGYVKGKYWIVFDSYQDETGSFIKLLDWDFFFPECKRHSLEKRAGGEAEKDPGYFKYILYFIGSYLKFT